MAQQGFDRMIELVELNTGNWKPEAVAIVDVNYKVWRKKGDVPKKFIEYYRKFPLSEMNTGDSIHSGNTFLMKVTDKTGIIVVMRDLHIARLAAINLRGRINALSDFYSLEKFIMEKEKSYGRIQRMSDTEKEMW